MRKENVQPKICYVVENVVKIVNFPGKKTLKYQGRLMKEL
jgi:hypothetical protein